MPTPDPETNLPPFALANPDPEPLQLVNELHRHGTNMNDFGIAITKLRETHREAYLALVAAFRSKP